MNSDGQPLIGADLSRKAIAQVQRFVRLLLKDDNPTQKIKPENIESIIKKGRNHAPLRNAMDFLNRREFDEFSPCDSIPPVTEVRANGAKPVETG